MVSVLDAVLVGIATFFWLSYVPIAINSLYKLMKNRKLFVEKDLRRIHNDPAIIFQITTRSATRTPVVKRGIASVVSAASKVNFSNYRISVVTDDPQDEETLADCTCEVVTVPSSYHTDAIKKGRALQYSVEHRQRMGTNTNKFWIFHMDDESYVTPQTILALLKYIREKKGIASEGPIFYPLKFESANRITAIAESIRPYACYDCVTQMTRPPPLHMHGSNLLVRSDVEDEIGWKFGPTLAEDQMFGFLVYQRYGPGSMGWHGGILLEQPPLDLKDHFLQRRRWVLGTMQNLHKFPRMHRFKLMFKSVTYFLGFASAVASTALMVNNYVPLVWTIPDLNSRLTGFMSLPDSLANISLNSMVTSLAAVNPVQAGIGAVLLLTSIIWLASYQLGLFLNLRYSGVSSLKKFLLHVQTLVLCPIIGLIETFPAFWATIEYGIRRKARPAEKVPVYDFYVIRK
jgi:cellulose synthase/poly-beta-1,6-N-acetylglucosamine synthase-like glycosyltransferase